MIPLGLERPVALVLLALLPLFWWSSWRHRHATGRARAIMSSVTRSVLVALLAFSLAQPSIIRRGEGVTLLVVADVSQSIPSVALERVEKALQRAVTAHESDVDRVGVVTLARGASVAQMPEVHGEVSFGSHGGDLDASDLAKGIRRAIAVLPADTMNRILLVSDGNETAGSVREAAELARANGIPIDVVPIEYQLERATVFEGIRAPTRARVGQSIDLRCFIRSQGGAKGTLYLTENGRRVDLDSAAPGEGRAIELSSGPNTVEIPVSVDRSGAQRYEAVFEPDEESRDGIVQNKRGATTVFVSGEGRVLVVGAPEESEAVVGALQAGGISVETAPPEALEHGIAYMAAYDAIVLANVARYEIDNTTDRMLHAYVHDLGGGMLVLGGDKSFGAGGWIDSETSRAWPVRLDPPATRELPRGALALVMHSCEMADANYWSEVVATSAIEALSRLDYVGIVVFGIGSKGGVLGSSWYFPMQIVGDKSAAIAAAKSMPVGDMPDFTASMTVALEGLRQVKAGQRHAIVISDGDPMPPTKELMDEYRALKVTVTTVMLAGHGDAMQLQNMKAMAELTGGSFYHVTNPKLLPKIFVKEASLVSRTLIVEGDFQPVVAPSIGGPLDGVSQVPPVTGYVLTVPREGLGQVAIINRTAEGNDPIYAYWNYGIGKCAVYTSDLRGRWGSAWPSWGGFQSMWERTLRWMMRPASASNVLLKTTLDGEDATVDLEATRGEGGLANFMRTRARVVNPDGTVAPLSLEQVGPGRYRGHFRVSETGSYLVDVGLLDGAGHSTAGSVQGAIAIAYPREFRTTRDNSALLRATAEATGGRVLSPGDLAVVNLFDRAGLHQPESVRRIWEILAIIAAALLVIDVAVRRLSVDREAARDLAQQALGGGSASAGKSVAAWRKARSRTAETAPGRADAAGPAIPARGAAPMSQPPFRDVPPAAPAPTGTSDADATAPEESPLERLHRAKRRAHGGDGGDQAP